MMDAYNKFYGLYLAVCKDTEDPQSRSRIRVKCPQVFGNNLSNWAEACLPVTDNTTHDAHVGTTETSSGGDPSHTHTVSLNLTHTSHVKLPRLDQTVWVMFAGGNPDYPVWIGVGA